MWGWHMWDGWGWGSWLIGGVLMLLFWGGVIVLAFFAIRALMRSGPRRDEERYTRRRGETPLQILDDRYARGDISREEYLDMKRDLDA